MGSYKLGLKPSEPSVPLVSGEFRRWDCFPLSDDSLSRRTPSDWSLPPSHRIRSQADCNRRTMGIHWRDVFLELPAWNFCRYGTSEKGIYHCRTRRKYYPDFRPKNQNPKVLDVYFFLPSHPRQHPQTALTLTPKNLSVIFKTAAEAEAEAKAGMMPSLVDRSYS